MFLQGRNAQKYQFIGTLHIVPLGEIKKYYSIDMFDRFICHQPEEVIVPDQNDQLEIIGMANMLQKREGNCTAFAGITQLDQVSKIFVVLPFLESNEHLRLSGPKRSIMSYRMSCDIGM